MISWKAFETSQMALASAGKNRLIGTDGVAIGFLGTVSPSGESNIAPVCPVFSGDHLYIIASAKTPKARDLSLNGFYSLHAFLGDNDEEFQVTGRATLVTEQAEIEQVQSDIPFASFDKRDPIFRLRVGRVLRVYWENVGQANTKAVRQAWQSSG